MKTRKILLIFSFFLCGSLLAQTEVRDEYIRKYYKLAIQEMQSYGIPASITMAQGILESGNGTTYLATEANNHFGIKCHDWTGPSVRQDDDEKNECFRKYDHPLRSYEDHSKFLTTRSRYAFLFDYHDTDYVAWAKGLKKAGYATDPKYPQKLIRIIEENELYLLDEYVLAENPQVDDLPKAIRLHEDVALVAETVTEKAPDLEPEKVLTPIKKTIHTSDEGLHYIVIHNETTFAQIAEEHYLHRWEIYKFNDVPRNSDKKPERGERIYLERKRSKLKKTMKHTVKPGDTMYGISQFYGIKLKSLYRINMMDKGTQPQVGGVLYFNKKAVK